MEGRLGGDSTSVEPNAASIPKPVVWPCKPYHSFILRSCFSPHCKMMWLHNINDPHKTTKDSFKLLKKQYGRCDGNRNFNESDGSLDLAPVEKGTMNWPKTCERIDLDCLGTSWEQDSLVSVCRKRWLFFFFCKSSQQIFFLYVMSTMF